LLKRGGNSSNFVSKVTTFFRHCPACGRRFEIRLIEKKLVDERQDQEIIKHDLMIPNPSSSKFTLPPVVVEESVPLTIDVTEFQYSYRCKHCGHEWSEKHLEQHETH
jgi:DNA-directed RNA polymerase subunit RPC12/RpoP